MHGKKGSGCAYPHPPMCFKYIKRGPKGCAKRTSCNFVHPKLCRASLVSGKCDRNRCYFYHITGSARSNHMNATSNPQNNNSQGPDKLNIRHLKHIGPFGLAFLTSMFKTALNKNIIPHTWKLANIVPIPKPNKDTDKAQTDP